MDESSRNLFWIHGRHNIIGLLSCIILFCAGFLIHGNTGLYVNISGFLIVVGGTLGATFLSYRVERLKILVKVLKTCYTREPRNPDEIVEILVDLSVKRRIRGILSLQDDEDESSIIFLRQAIGLLVDGYSQSQIREALNTEMYFFRIRRDETIRVLKSMAEMAPSFGLVGSVVGLIGMLSEVGDSAIILSTVPIALTSTLYGIVLANFFCLPFAANIRERTFNELLIQKIITEGVIAISANLHPRILDRKLKSFLTPSARTGEPISIAKIKKRFEIKEQKE
ncbi:MotA3 [Desulfamplus magnetovallimortis]|uniref:MotA3 n=1 Tax=Desulfamplus magnetovallimortis TaxID=1246637 RepID=A0A1W1HAV4_9BACT|nr:MotA/TolQ/ExbB proton channel family protein [Desulfamplus magnetovallimortis]SLM29508.1 MotA3 [Desulfamplus magnetovallimortis]